jgi:hypothetical protein
VLESHSLYVAVNTLRRRATQQGMNLLSYIKTGAAGAVHYYAFQSPKCSSATCRAADSAADRAAVDGI